MARKTIERLEARNVLTGYDFYGDDTPYIWRVLPSVWSVQQHGVDLNDGKGLHHRGRWFSYVTREQGKAALAEAQRWASERFGVKTWARDPFGSYGPTDYVVARLAALLEEKRDG